MLLSYSIVLKRIENQCFAFLTLTFFLSPIFFPFFPTTFISFASYILLSEIITKKKKDVSIMQNRLNKLHS